MKTKTKTIIIILVIVIVIAAVIWIWAGNKQQDTSVPAAGTPEAKKAEEAEAQVKMPLVQGSKGELVKSIQVALNTKYNSGLKTDGIWGAKTQAALIANKLSTTIYWKQWYEITGFPMTVGGKLVAKEIDPTAFSWLERAALSFPTYLTVI